MKIAMLALLSYLIGSLSGSYILGKLFLDKDIRKYGSGNAGTTNAMRVFGKKWGTITFIIDFIKGVIVSFLSIHLLKLDLTLVLILGLFCILGHDYPFYMKFKGGKGVATTIGIFSLIDVKITLACVLIWAIITITSRMVSLGSISLFLSISLLFFLFKNLDILQLSIIFCISILGIFKHRSNIVRIIEKRENKIGEKRL